MKNVEFDRKWLIKELERKNAELNQMEELMKQKDSALKGSMDKAFTIDILIFKIKQMNHNFNKDKTKLDHDNQIRVQHLSREIDQV